MSDAEYYRMVETGTTAAEPYWRLERYQDVLGKWHEQWQPSAEMTYFMGCLMSMQARVESAVVARPSLILLPADRVPSEAEGGGSLFGIPFAVSDKVTVPSLVYPATERPVDIAALSDTP